jgi:hypothetical protein
VREAAKTIDDCLVRNDIFSPAPVAQLTDQFDRQLLIRALLAMFEGKIEKIPPLGGHREIETLFNGSPG